MEKQEAVDKVLGFLKEFAGEIGGTAKELWPYAVENYQWSAISYMIGGVIAIVFFAIVSRKVKNIATVMYADAKKEKESTFDAEMTVCISWVVLGVGILIGTCVILSHLAAAVSPVGGLLRHILGS